MSDENGSNDPQENLLGGRASDLNEDLVALECRLCQMNANEAKKFVEHCKDSESEICQIMGLWVADQNDDSSFRSLATAIRKQLKDMSGMFGFGQTDASLNPNQIAPEGEISESPDNSPSLQWSYIHSQLVQMLAEFIGTFLLAFAVSVSPQAGLMLPFLHICYIFYHHTIC